MSEEKLFNILKGEFPLTVNNIDAVISTLLSNGFLVNPPPGRITNVYISRREFVLFDGYGTTDRRIHIKRDYLQNYAEYLLSKAMGFYLHHKQEERLNERRKKTF